MKKHRGIKEILRKLKKQHGYIMILIAFALPMLFVGVNYIIKKMELSEKFIDQTGSISRIADSVIRAYNPSVNFSDQKEMIYSAAATALNDTAFKIYKKMLLFTKNTSTTKLYKKTVTLDLNNTPLHKVIYNFSLKQIKENDQLKDAFLDPITVGRLLAGQEFLISAELEEKGISEGDKKHDVYSTDYGKQYQYKLTFYSSSGDDTGIDNAYKIFDEDTNTLDVQLDTGKKAIICKSPKINRITIAHIPECDANIILAIPTNFYMFFKEEEISPNTYDEGKGTFTPGTASVVNYEGEAPIKVVSNACVKFLKNNFSHLYGVAVGVIPYSGKVSLCPEERADAFTVSVPGFVDFLDYESEKKDAGNVKGGSNNSTSTGPKPYIKQAALYATVGEQGADLASSVDKAGWNKDSVGAGIMYRLGEDEEWNGIKLFSGASDSGESGVKSYLLDNSAPKGIGSYMRMPRRPCYSAHCNMTGNICEKNCPIYMANPYYIYELTDNVEEITHYLKFLSPYIDYYNKSNFIFLPLHWAGNLLSNWTRYPSENNAEKIAHPSRKDKKNFVVIIVNKPSSFEPHELTYLGFDNDNAEIPISETDAIAFKATKDTKDGDTKKGTWDSTKGLIKLTRLDGSSELRLTEGGLYCNGKFRITFPKKNLIYLRLKDAKSRVYFYGDNRNVTGDINTELTTLEDPGIGYLSFSDEPGFTFSGSNNFYDEKGNTKIAGKYLGDFSSTGGKHFGHNLSTKKLKYKLEAANIRSATLKHQVLRCYAHYNWDKKNKPGIIKSNGHCEDVTDTNAEAYTDPCISTNDGNYNKGLWSWVTALPQLAQVKAFDFNPKCYGMKTGFFAMTVGDISEREAAERDDKEGVVKVCGSKSSGKKINFSGATNVYQLFNVSTSSGDYIQVHTGKLYKASSYVLTPLKDGSKSAQTITGTIPVNGTRTQTISCDVIKNNYKKAKIKYALQDATITGVNVNAVNMVRNFSGANSDEGTSGSFSGDLPSKGEAKADFPAVLGYLAVTAGVYRRFSCASIKKPDWKWYAWWRIIACPGTHTCSVYYNDNTLISNTDYFGCNHRDEEYIFSNIASMTGLRGKKWENGTIQQVVKLVETFFEVLFFPIFFFKDLFRPAGDTYPKNEKIYNNNRGFSIKIKDDGNHTRTWNSPRYVKVLAVNTDGGNVVTPSTDKGTISYFGRGDATITMQSNGSPCSYDLNNFFFINNEIKTLQGGVGSSTDKEVLSNKGIYYTSSEENKGSTNKEGWICFCGDGTLVLTVATDPGSKYIMFGNTVEDIEGNKIGAGKKRSISGETEIYILKEQMKKTPKDENGNYNIEVQISNCILDELSISNRSYYIVDPEAKMVGQVSAVSDNFQQENNQQNSVIDWTFVSEGAINQERIKGYYAENTSSVSYINIAGEGNKMGFAVFKVNVKKPFKVHAFTPVGWFGNQNLDLRDKTGDVGLYTNYSGNTYTIPVNISVTVPKTKYDTPTLSSDDVRGDSVGSSLPELTINSSRKLADVTIEGWEEYKWRTYYSYLHRYDMKYKAETEGDIKYNTKVEYKCKLNCSNEDDHPERKNGETEDSFHDRLMAWYNGLTEVDASDGNFKNFLKNKYSSYFEKGKLKETTGGTNWNPDEEVYKFLSEIFETNKGNNSNSNSNGATDSQLMSELGKFCESKFSSGNDKKDLYSKTSLFTDQGSNEEIKGAVVGVSSKDITDDKDHDISLSSGLSTSDYAYSTVERVSDGTKKNDFYYKITHYYVDGSCKLKYGLSELCPQSSSGTSGEGNSTDSNSSAGTETPTETRISELEIMVDKTKDKCAVKKYDKGEEVEPTTNKGESETNTNLTNDVFLISSVPMCERKYKLKSASVTDEKNKDTVQILNDGNITASYDTESAEKYFVEYNKDGAVKENTGIHKPSLDGEVAIDESELSEDIYNNEGYKVNFSRNKDGWSGDFGNYSSTVTVAKNTHELAVTGSSLLYTNGKIQESEIEAKETEDVTKSVSIYGGSTEKDGCYITTISVTNCQLSEPNNLQGQVGDTPIPITYGARVDTVVEIRPDVYDFIEAGNGWYVVAVPCRNVVITGVTIEDTAKTFQVHGFERGKGVRIFDFSTNSSQDPDIDTNIDDGEVWSYVPIRASRNWVLPEDKSNKDIYFRFSKTLNNSKADFFIELWDYMAVAPGVQFKFGDKSPKKILGVEYTDTDTDSSGKGYTTLFSFSGSCMLFWPYGTYNVGNEGLKAVFSDTGIPMSGVFAGFTLPYNSALANNGYQKWDGTNFVCASEAIQHLSKDACNKLKTDFNAEVYVIKYGTEAKEANELGDCAITYSANDAKELDKALEKIAKDIKEKSNATTGYAEIKEIEEQANR